MEMIAIRARGHARRSYAFMYVFCRIERQAKKGISRRDGVLLDPQDAICGYETELTTP